MIFKKLTALLVVAAVISASYPVFAYDAPISPSPIMAEAYILIDAQTGTILRGCNEHQRIYPASLTKVLTALLFMEYLCLEEIYIVGREVYTIPFGSSIVNHMAGDAVSGENLLRGLLMHSGNDSASIIVVQAMRAITGEAAMPFTRAEAMFAELMTQRAYELGAVNSNFTNAHGFHHANQFTTVYDLALIAQEATKCQTIMRMVGELYFRGPSAVSNNPAHRITQLSLRTRNALIADGPNHYPYATGLRTGFTDQAGYSLIATASRNGVDLIAVISNSPPIIDAYGNATPSRWSDARYLLEYGFNNFTHHTSEYYAPPIDDAPNMDILRTIAGTIFSPRAIPFWVASAALLLSVATNAEYYTPPIAETPYEITSRSFTNTIFSLRAIPFWAIGVMLLVFLVFVAIKTSAGKRRRSDFTLPKR